MHTDSDCVLTQKHRGTLRPRCHAHTQIRADTDMHRHTPALTHTWRSAQIQRSTRPCPLILTDTHTGAETCMPMASIHKHSHVHTGTHTHKHPCRQVSTHKHTILVTLSLVPRASSFPGHDHPEVAGPSQPWRAGVISSGEASKDSFGGGVDLGWEGHGEVAKEIQNLSCPAAHTPSSQPASPQLSPQVMPRKA